mmetsp:Transcript_39486/g.97500  ORF Transcript_39486/g.97500 Transcript_39486/m.97500 type:complete len:283 (+) Transcript_39486:275-1123(+)
MLAGPSSSATAFLASGAVDVTAAAASIASSSRSIASSRVCTRLSMSSRSCAIWPTPMVSRGTSCNSRSASNCRAMLPIPPRTDKKTDFMCSCLLRIRSYLLCASFTPSLIPRAFGLRLAPGLEDVYLSRCTCSSARRFCSCNASMRACESRVICTRCLCVSSWVRNFSITSDTSDTPVTSLIFWKADSYALMLFCSSSIPVSESMCMYSWLRLAPSGSSAAGMSLESAAFSRLDNSLLISTLCSTSVFCSATSRSRNLRSSAAIASRRPSSALAASLEWLAS